MATILLLLHQVLIEHLLVANFIVVDLIIELELDAIKLDLITVGVEAQPVHFLVDHFHDLILIKSVQVSGVPANDAHLILVAVREIMLVTDNSLQARDAVSTRVFTQIVVRSVVLLAAAHAILAIDVP